MPYKYVNYKYKYMPSQEWIQRWALSWHNFWLDFDGAPFTAHTFPG